MDKEIESEVNLLSWQQDSSVIMCLQLGYITDAKFEQHSHISLDILDFVIIFVLRFVLSSVFKQKLGYCMSGTREDMRPKSHYSAL